MEHAGRGSGPRTASTRRSIACACACRPFVEELTAAITELESSKQVRSRPPVTRPLPGTALSPPLLARSRRVLTCDRRCVLPPVRCCRLTASFWHLAAKRSSAPVCRRGRHRKQGGGGIVLDWCFSSVHAARVAHKHTHNHIHTLTHTHTHTHTHMEQAWICRKSSSPTLKR